MGENTDITALQQLVQDTSADFTDRLTALFSFERTAGKEAATELRLKLLRDPDRQFRFNMISQLGNTKQPRVVDALIVEVSQMIENDDMLIPILRALGTLGDPRASEAIIPHLSTSKPLTRANAAFTLGKLGDTRAIPALEQLVNDKEFAWEEDHGGPKHSVGDVARRAIETIRNSGEKPQSPSEKPWWKLW
jgi:HEAT repeat protein